MMCPLPVSAFVKSSLMPLKPNRLLLRKLSVPSSLLRRPSKIRKVQLSGHSLNTDASCSLVMPSPITLRSSRSGRLQPPGTVPTPSQPPTKRCSWSWATCCLGSSRSRSWATRRN
uniref:Uncharacterized protein n=1 Tax=Aegilops tauschii subsp. strangulata TaxID=200361 RepID=A0A453MG05_AEGTS